MTDADSRKPRMLETRFVAAIALRDVDLVLLEVLWESGVRRVLDVAGRVKVGLSRTSRRLAFCGSKRSWQRRAECTTRSPGMPRREEMDLLVQEACCLSLQLGSCRRVLRRYS